MKFTFLFRVGKKLKKRKDWQDNTATSSYTKYNLQRYIFEEVHDNKYMLETNHT